MNGATVAKFALGLLLGMAFAWGHLHLLRRALERGFRSAGELARRQIVRGMPMRVLLWAPAVILVGYAGLAACVGLVLGSVASRWLYWRTVVQPV